MSNCVYTAKNYIVAGSICWRYTKSDMIIIPNYPCGFINVVFNF